MRKVLAAVALGTAVLVPVAPASASAICLIVTEDGQTVCVSPPCPAGTVNDLDRKLLGDALNDWACVA